MRTSETLRRVAFARSTHNSGIAFAASVIYSFLGFLVTTVLTQRMTPEDFGLYRLVIDTVTIAFPLLLFGLQYTWNRSIAASSSIRNQCQSKAAAVAIGSCVVIVVLLLARGLTGPLSEVQDSDTLLNLLPYSFLICVPLFRDITEGVLIAQGRITAAALGLIVPQTLVVICLLLMPLPLGVMTVAVATAAIVWVSSASVIILTGVDFRHLGSSVLRTFSENFTMGFPLYLAGLVLLVGRNVVQIMTGSFLGNIEYGNLSLAIMISGFLMFVPAAISKAEFRNFATAPHIDRRILAGALAVMVVFAGLLMAATHAFVFYVAGPDYGTSMMVLPPLLLAATFQGLGDLLNRFFLAKGRAKVITRVSLTAGGLASLSGVALIHALGLWGVIASRIVASTLFLCLYAWEYTRPWKD